VQKEVLKLMNDLVSQEGSALIFVSHDLPVVSSMTERVAVMQRGKIVELASVGKLFANATDDYSKMLIRTAQLSDDSFTRFTSGSVQ
jgi:peptide/nickel transport system ATP-binding protein